MNKLTLYRGITVNENIVDRVVDDIKKNGLNVVKESHWKGFIWKDLRNDLKRLMGKENLSRKDTEPDSIWVKTEKGSEREYIEGYTGICFADKMGANYYAFHHNINENDTVPIVIKVSVDINDTAIDGRDFLYTVFGFIDRNDIEKSKRQKDKLSRIYGEKICLYVDKILNHINSDIYAVCDLAIIDNDIIKYHSKNDVLLKGRWRTKFKSAFYVKTPIDPKSITEILINKPYHDKPCECITLDEILER